MPSYSFFFDVLPGRGRPGIPSSEAALLPPTRRERRLIPTHGRAGNSAGSRWIKPPPR
ncbi:MAG: hypothetical protein HYS86_01140 [Candidatus Chisholmbacteria bacterium]|nr:hypothetical protein [Candidatus Chisholmbacteria bacterium]